MNTMLGRTLGIAALLLALGPQCGHSQARLSIFPGDRVRVTVHPGKAAAHGADGVMINSGDPIVGHWEGSADGTILLRDEGGSGSWQILEESVQRIEMSLGHERRMGQSVFKWTVGLAAGFGILGAASWHPCTETGFMACFMSPQSRSEQFALAALGGAVLGIPVGFLAGLRKHEIWSERSVRYLRASIETSPGGGIGLGLSIGM